MVRDDTPPPVMREVVRDDGPAPWSILVAGVGLGGLVSAAALGVAAQTTRDGAPSAASAIEALARVEQAQDLATATNVAWIAGGVLVSVGVVWLIVEVASGGGASRAGIEPSAGGVRGRF